jgi:hypothetical protein
MSEGSSEAIFLEGPCQGTRAALLSALHRTGFYKGVRTMLPARRSSSIKYRARRNFEKRRAEGLFRPAAHIFDNAAHAGAGVLSKTAPRTSSLISGSSPLARHHGEPTPAFTSACLMSAAWYLCEGRSAVGHTFSHGKDRPLRPEGIFRERLPGAAEGYG